MSMCVGKVGEEWGAHLSVEVVLEERDRITHQNSLVFLLLTAFCAGLSNDEGVRVRL